MITFVFGKPGVGKTAFLCADAVLYLMGSAQSTELWLDCCSEVSSLGYPVPEHAPVYSNFSINVTTGYNKVVGSYYIDGFHLGFENPYVPVMPVFPGSKIYLSEAQRYYNSRKSRELPDWVSRYYEEHRHFGLDIMLDVQRPGLIDVNIRDIAGRFIEMQGVEVSEDKGCTKSTTFYYREFTSWSEVDRYLTSGAETYKEQTLTVPFNVFEHFRSQSYYESFLPAGDFWTMPHAEFLDVDDVEFAKTMYQQTPPEGFYNSSAKQKDQKKNRSIDYD